MRREGNYVTTSIQVREDLKHLCEVWKVKKKHSMREILEEAILSKTTPEDLAYLESVRLEKELEKKRQILEQDVGGIRL